MRRWTEAFSGFMPPFKSWMPPKVIAKAAAWGDRMLGSDMSASSTELSTLKYSFPDALPKVMRPSRPAACYGTTSSAS